MHDACPVLRLSIDAIHRIADFLGLREMLHDPIGYEWPLRTPISMHHDAGRLVDDHTIGIFIEDIDLW